MRWSHYSKDWTGLS